nr:InlB B-repeat-containing protein [Kiritimatiellia bacterium]
SDSTGENFYVLKQSTPYWINFHRNDSSSEKTETYEFEYGVDTWLPSLKELAWARRGYEFKGWATSAANAAAGKVWKKDLTYVSTATDAGKTLDVYAVWALKPGYFAVNFIRNDGAGTWRKVAFPYGTKTRMPSLAKGLGWARRGYDFMGWELTTANANDNTRKSPWKGDWAYLSTTVQPGETINVYARWKLKPGYYEMRFNKNDGTGKWRTLGYQTGTSARLSTISALGWTRSGHSLKGWGSSKANASKGKVWKTDGAWFKNATGTGKTISIYAIWN